MSRVKLASIVAWLVAISASAQAATWRWSAPEVCSEQTLRASVAQRIDGSMDALPLDIDVAISAGEDGFTATIVVGGAIADTRTLTSASCDELTDAIAIVIARLASVVARPSVAVAPPPVGVVEVGPIVARTIERPHVWNGGARLSGIVGTGATPSLGVAAELGVWAQWRSVSLELAVSHWKSNTAALGYREMAGVDVALDAIAVRAGWRPGHRLRGWLVGELGSLDGAGFGLGVNRRGSARWSALGGGGAFAWPVVDHVSLVAAAELEFLIDHVRFAIDSGSILYETPPVAVRAGLGVEIGWR